MLRMICLFILYLITVSVYAQQPAPGGVPGMVAWLASSVREDGAPRWIDRLSEEEDPVDSSVDLPLFNFHPAPRLRGDEAIPLLPLPVRTLKQATVFAVHHPDDTLSERVVWSLDAGDGRPLVLTTHRLADLRDTSYLNFLGPEKARPGIKTYYQRRVPEAETTTTSATLLLGTPPARPRLPVYAYRGRIPEFIVYDRVLSPRERLQVESYLALKYGLTLTSDANYLDGAGEVIWERRRQGAFVHRLAGIGRDDEAGLLQKQSTSSYEPGMLTLSAGRPASDNAANRTELTDRSWLIWGDDGGAWELRPVEFGQPRRLDRTWRITAHGETPLTTLQVELGRFATERSPGQTYWLLIDRSGTGKFAPGQVDYYPASEITGRAVAAFHGVRWDTDASGTDAFTLGLGPAFMGLAWQDPPTCTPKAVGRLFLSAVGGQPPYAFQLEGPTGTDRWQRADGALQELGALPPGPYRLTIRDAGGNLFRDSLFFEAADAPVSPLADEYLLSSDQPLRLDAAATGAASQRYEWTTPDGRRHEGPQLEIRESGTYQLTIDRAGCLARQQIAVREAPADAFREAALYPNPARREQPFQVAVHLARPEGIQVTILDVAGRIIRERRQPVDDYHRFSETLSAAGAYLIRLHSGGAVTTLPLIVE